MKISIEQALEFLTEFLTDVMTQDSLEGRSSYFNYPDPRIHFMETGETTSLQEQLEAHQAWVDEEFELGQFRLSELNNNPARVRVIGTVYWQATVKDTGAMIKAVVEDDLIIERNDEGELQFVFFGINFMHNLTDTVGHLVK